AARRRLRAASQAGTKAGGLRRGRGGEEDHVGRPGGTHRADRPAVDPRGQHTAHEAAVEAGVPGGAGAVADLTIEHRVQCAPPRPRSPRTPDDRVRKRPARRSRCGQALRMFAGWIVVGVAFLIATFAFGIGFYGVGLYMVVLHDRLGWPVSLISLAITGYYVLSAAMITVVGDAFDRFGPRRVLLVAIGGLAGGVAPVCPPPPAAD